MAKTPHRSETIVTAALTLAAERGWRAVSLADVAARAGVPLADLVEEFPSKAAILDGYARQIDRRMMEGPIDGGDSARDRLFDVVMRRFEAMAPHRKALGRILCDSGDDLWALACGTRRAFKAMALTLETAGIPSSGLTGLLRVEGLAVAYAYVFKAFLDDDSPDLARTMAALDAALRRAESVAALVWRRPMSGTP